MYTSIGILSTLPDTAELMEIIQGYFPETTLHHITAPTHPAPDLLISLGGDGTLLSAMDTYPAVPVLGINFGTVGFLTAGHSSELHELLTQLQKDTLHREARTLLEIEHNGQKYIALNEAVLKGLTKVISVAVAVDGYPLTTLRGDGVILGTSSGSTAYLLSTGTPVATPSLDCFILSGLNTYSLSRNGLILDIHRTVTLTLEGPLRDPQVYLIYDGKKEIPLTAGDTVTIRKAPMKATLLFKGKHHFFEALRHKLHYGH